LHIERNDLQIENTFMRCLAEEEKQKEVWSLLDTVAPSLSNPPHFVFIS